MLVDLVRLEEFSKSGTFGVITVNGKIICYSLELPWGENIENVSCIPEGEYQCVRRDKWFNSKRYGYTYEIESVPGRTDILIHPANWISQIKGCIATGTSIGTLSSKRAAKSSGRAFKRLKEAIGNRKGFRIRIIKLILGNKISIEEEYGRHGESR